MRNTTGGTLAIVAAALLGLAAAAAGEGPAAGAEEGFVEVPGGRLAYQRQGAGEPLVLLHDGLLPGVTWDAQMPVLSRYFAAVRYDRRGYGASATTSQDFSNVEDLRALLDALGIPRAILAGCSSGGGLAADFALAYPERVAALVLAGPVFSGFPYSEHFWARAARNSRSVYTGGDQAAAIEAWAADRYLVFGDGEARRQLRRLLLRFPASATGSTGNGREPAGPAAGRLAAIEAPTLLITGAADIPDVHAQIGAFAAAVPSARRQLIEDAGHLAHLERPAEWNRALLDFLAPEAWARERLAALRAAAAPDLEAFADDEAAPLAVEIAGRELRQSPAGVEHPVLELSYAGRDGRVPALLVLPSGAMAKAEAPAVLFLHHGQGDRRTFLDEALALALADRGVVSLSVDAPHKRPGYQRPAGLPWQAAPERREIVQTVVDLRRGIGLLAARPEVDRGRIGYVGYSLGATMGARLVGADGRLRAAVLVAGYPALSAAMSGGHHRSQIFFRELSGPAEREAYLAALRPLDGVHFLGRPGAPPVLLQFARDDEFVSAIDAAIFRAALPEAPAALHPGGHFGLGEGPPREERAAFLLERLAAP